MLQGFLQSAADVESLAQLDDLLLDVAHVVFGRLRVVGIHGRASERVFVICIIVLTLPETRGFLRKIQLLSLTVFGLRREEHLVPVEFRAAKIGSLR